MDERKNDAENTADRKLVAIRFFDAPQELVWKMWTDPKHIAHWWGPNGFTNTIHEMDVKPGGIWQFIMHGPDGVDYPNKIIYQEVVKPERLVYWHEAPPFRVTVSFVEQGGKTKLTMQILFESAELRDRIVKKFGAAEGQSQTLDRLGQHLGVVNATTHQTVCDVFFKRIFNAPRQLVFDAWTKQEHLVNWWGPQNFTNPVCDIDPQPGGAIRIDMRSPNGTIYPMSGVFLEIAAPERLIFTSSALDEAGKPLFEVLNIVTFEEHNGKTTMTLHASVVKSTGAAAAQHLNGMEVGWSQSLERLHKSIEEMKVMP